jgi:hypothetical protein
MPLTPLLRIRQRLITPRTQHLLIGHEKRGCLSLKGGIMKPEKLAGHHCVRFAGDPDLLAAWRSASNVIGPSRPAAKPEGSEAPPSEGAAKPAA